MKKPTRRDLLVVIGQLQGVLGRAQGANHDRNPNRFAEVNGALCAGFDLCVEALGQDAQIPETGPWAHRINPKKRFV